MGQVNKNQQHIYTIYVTHSILFIYKITHGITLDIWHGNKAAESIFALMIDKMKIDTKCQLSEKT